MAKNNERDPQTAQIAIGSSAADALNSPLMYFPKKSKILSVKLINRADLAASDTNFFVGQVKAGANVVAQINTKAANQGALVADTAKDVPVDPAFAVVEKDTVLKFSYDETDAGSNVALTNAILIVTFFPL